MRLKLLPVLLLLAGSVYGQDTIRSLVITEAFVGRNYRNHAEITNMGTESVNLSNFVFGRCQNVNYTTGRAVIPLPDRVLQPGESFLLGEFSEWIVDIPENGWNVNLPYMLGTPKEWDELLDMKCHRNENLWNEPLSPLDSVTSPQFIGNWWGRSALFIEQQLTDTTAVVIDQVGGVWDHPNGNGNQRGLSYEDSYSVAGFPNATSQARLIRKFSVKTGNLNFADARGIGEDDSEWLAIPFIFSPARMQPWTLGSHGDFNLDANTLEPLIDGMEVDFAGKKITVPWGLRKPDGIMANMKKKGGVAWYYHMNTNPEDSLSFAVCTGDKLEVLVAGINLDRATFDIVVSDPKPSDNIVIPRFKRDPEAGLRASIETMDQIRDNWSEWPIVTSNESGIDTIRGRKVQRYSLLDTLDAVPNCDYYLGIPYATRVDTLLKLLDKPTNASWEILWVDGVERPDLKYGDKLKVTSQNGAVKEYFIYVNEYQPSDNTKLSAITWPDIPDFYRGLFGWEGDTIPYFEPYSQGYQVKVPIDVEGIPALMATPAENNIKVEVKRANNLFGSLEERTTSFKVIAENDTSFRYYDVILMKEQMPTNQEPFHAEPFVSNIAMRDQFGNNFIEICNPGNQPLDLSNYMFSLGYATPDPAVQIQRYSLPENWNNRYGKYVPGYKWVDEATWAQTPGILTQDLAVNPIVMPGDVFCMGSIVRNEVLWRIDANYKWPVVDQLDVQFKISNTNLGPFTNPWGENVGAIPITGNAPDNFFIFKILNDSVKLGLKPATDPNDFEIVEAIGKPDGTNWSFSDPNQNAPNFNCSAWIRKPEFPRPNPIMGASFGTEFDSCEWVFHGETYWGRVGIVSPLTQAYAPNEIGNHFFIPPTHYMSTVGSNRYKVSDGYGKGEEISGIITGTTAADFLANIIKLNEGQTLTVKNIDGAQVGMDAALSVGDTLVVLSADSVNTTWYELKVADIGLSSNALLTSDLFDITIQEEPKSADDENAGSGLIEGFQFGSTLQYVYNNVDVPAGATLTVIDSDGSYVPFKRLNFNKDYVTVQVSNSIYFEVIAEDGVTAIVYQLMPTSSSDDAFVTSDLLNVVQSEMLIEYVPAGEFAAGGAITVPNFLKLLTPSVGATMKLVDKYGLERTNGAVIEDDKVLVTSASGNVTCVYHLSFLPNPFVPEVLYLAYVLSNEYIVDQVNYVIDGPTRTTTLNDFYSKITASSGATAVVVDAAGNEKTSGDLDDGDRLKVTSADGKIQVFYEIDVVPESANVINSGQIRLYPNPTGGLLNVAGVTPGGRIQIFNTMGAAIRDIKIQRTIESISLDEPAGLYLIVISDKNQLLGRYKVLKR
jgi:hypothetical protein